MLLVLVALLAPIGWARGGHEVSVYPSYYPHEIRIETVPPDRAADLLRDAGLHAYLGPEPGFAGAPPKSVRAVELLGNFVTVRINPALVAQDEHSACDIVEAIVRDMAGKEGLVFHPYPVTPFDGDYLNHVDQADAEKARLLGTSATPPRSPKVKADGVLAGLVRPEWRAQGVGLGCRGRGGRRGGAGGRCAQFAQRLARAGLGQDRVVSRRAPPGRCDRRSRSAAAHRGDGATPGERGLP